MMVYQINPILIEIAKKFKAAHTSEPDSVAAIALMIALNWRTNKQPYLPTISELTGTMFDMPEKLALKLHPFLVNQGHLLGQLNNNQGSYGGNYSEVLGMAKNVNTDYTLKSNLLGNPYIDMNDWEWGDYSWPFFTFIKLENPQSINYLQLKLSQS
jgi:hypothetical protein